MRSKNSNFIGYISRFLQGCKRFTIQVKRALFEQLSYLWDNIESIIKSLVVALIALSFMVSVYVAFLVFFIAMVSFVHKANADRSAKRDTDNLHAKGQFATLNSNAIIGDRLAHLYALFNGENKLADKDGFKRSDSYVAAKFWADSHFECAQSNSTFFPDKTALEKADINMFVGNQKDSSVRAIAFRGTSLQYVGLDKSIIYDTDPNGPGFSVFSEHKESMAKHSLADLDGIDQIDISGHSLGGSYAQYMLIEILQKMKDNPNTYKGIKSINMFLYNASGINDKSEKIAADLIKNHIRQGKKVNIAMFAREMDPAVHCGRQVGASLLKNGGEKNLGIYSIIQPLSASMICYMVAKLSLFLPHKIPFYSENHVNLYNYGPVFKSAVDHPFQYYNAECKNDRGYMQKMFDSKATSFVLNQYVYALLNKINNSDVPVVLLAILFLVSLMSCARSLVLLFRRPEFFSCIQVIASATFAIDTGIRLERSGKFFQRTKEWTYSYKDKMQAGSLNPFSLNYIS